MSGQADKIKGKVEEKAGELTDDEKLKRDGQVDRATGEVKEKLGEAKGKVEDVVDRAKDKMHDHT